MVASKATLRADVLRHVNDDGQKFWTASEVDGYLAQGYRELARATRMVWDQVYLENLPAGFSVSAAWERGYDGVMFDYGVANYTLDDEPSSLAGAALTGSANHTSPCELAFLSDAGASTAPSPLATLPNRLTDIDRPTWDGAAIAVLTQRAAEGADSRYESTRGEVVALMVRRQGAHAVRKVRAPASQADTYTVTGTWGTPRDVDDVTDGTITGAWGVPRRIPGHHPMGPESWGSPRRFYRDGKNVRVDHWREGREVVAEADAYELPARAAVALRDYALSRCYGRGGPAQDPRLAQYYGDRYQRAVQRWRGRVDRAAHQRAGQFGGAAPIRSAAPPRPAWPWNYGPVVR